MSAPAFDSADPGTSAALWREWLDPAGRPELRLDRWARVVVVGAHPDDESLGAGGLIAAAVRQGVPVELVCVTDGAASHPRSPTTGPEDLARRRRAEWQAALDALGVAAAQRSWLGFADGTADEHVHDIASRLVEVVAQAARADGSTLLVAPWREDGHPDHAAVGRAAAAAARRTDAELWEFPLWFWHWGTPEAKSTGGGDGLPARVSSDRLRPFQVSADERRAKSRAIDCHRSQVQPLSAAAGDEALLSERMLEHFQGNDEWFVATPGADCPDEALELLHGEVADPWGAETRWYEQRKRDLLLAMLPSSRFGTALEVGCSTGVFTERLATRADRVVGIDSSATAVAAARKRLADNGDVEILRREVSDPWPETGVQLVVVSEVGYFLSPATLETLVLRVETCLAPDGVVALCHWRHPIRGWLLDANRVHERFARAPGLPPVRARYDDRDVAVQIHARDWPEPDR